MAAYPQVGPGQVLAYIIDSGAVPVARPTEIFRQAARVIGEWIAFYNIERTLSSLDGQTPAGLNSSNRM